ncbi:hypothetical protein J3R83DRAFT_2019 [Lanmaoa asiatica]|nr:hypothetical protein J3R83DRAFT_2019 [Lanmaoa asiatica]
MTDKQESERLDLFDSPAPQNSQPIVSPVRDSAPLNVVLTDLDGLLALIYNLTTKLSLALKPAAPSYSASVPILRDLVQHVSALAHCARLLHHNLHGATLTKESDGPQDDPDNDFDDGWDEIGLGHATKMDKDELDRAKNVHQVLRLTTLLHKRIFLDLLAYPTFAPVAALDTLLLQSNLLLSTSDDLVAALYTPQDPAHVRNHILQLAEIATSLQTQIPVFFPLTDELTNWLHALNVVDRTTVSTSTSPSKKMADKKWFDTCVHQIVRLCTSASVSSTQTENPNGAALGRQSK